MNRILAATLSMLVICISALGMAAKDIGSKAEQHLIQLERDWSAAYLKHDTSTVDRILADEYVGIDGRGVITDKAQEIEEARAPRPGEPAPSFVVLDESVTDLKVRIYGNVAVVNGRVIERVRSNEQEGKIQYRRTTVWVRRQGRWRCVSFHGSRILDPTGP